MYTLCAFVVSYFTTLPTGRQARHEDTKEDTKFFYLFFSSCSLPTGRQVCAFVVRFLILHFSF